MISQNLAAAVALAAGFSLTAAQTVSKCNPTLGQSCDPDQAFGGQWTYDFTAKSAVKDLKDAWNLDGGVEFGSPATVTFDKNNGASFLISKSGQSPTINTTHYMFFGKLDVVMQPASGAGIISSIVLQTDDLDEIDWEFIGSHQNEVQTNYYQKGNFDDHTHGKTHSLSINPQSGLHTYTIEWTPTFITWSIDGSVVRSQTAASSAGGAWPQTPAQVKIGTWPAGDAAAQGTSDWAGGKVNWAAAPFTAVYKSITLTDYGNGHAGAASYSFKSGDNSGSKDSIQVTGGSARAMPATPGASFAAGNSSAAGNSGSASASTSASATVSAKNSDTTATGVQAPVNPTAGLTGGNATATTLTSTAVAPTKSAGSPTTSAPTKPTNAGGRNAASLGVVVGLAALVAL